MGFEREPIFHDVQDVRLAGPITTTSSTFVDIPGAVLTTKDLGQLAKYMFWVATEVESTNNNSTIQLRATVDGTPGMSTSISFGPAGGGNPQTISLIGVGDAIESGEVIQLQWNVSVGTAQINSLTLMFDGIPEIRIV